MLNTCAAYRGVERPKLIICIGDSLFIACANRIACNVPCIIIRRIIDGHDLLVGYILNLQWIFIRNSKQNKHGSAAYYGLTYIYFTRENVIGEIEIIQLHWDGG
jgi:hypothetical protein